MNWFVGQGVQAGERLNLTSGYAELEFDDGSRVVLAGPARFEVASNSSARLTLGKVAAKVPVKARGFSIATPAANIVDLGTEFGVHVDEQGGTEVHVFSGRVRAEYGQPSARPQAPAVLVLEANEAARLQGGEAFQRQASRPDDFVRGIPERVSLELPATGSTGSAGDDDFNWSLVAASHEADFTPRPAKIMAGHPEWGRLSQNSRWIFLSSEATLMPNETTLTYRTEIDLTDYDPATAQVRGVYLVDDHLLQIRLNGRVVHEPARAKGDAQSPGQFRLAGDFLPGVNALEFVVRNWVHDGVATEMGLLVELDGTARRIRNGGEKKKPE